MPGDIWDRIRDAESNFLERKPKLVNQEGFRKTLVAFANSVPQGQEAVLFVGVGDSGSIVGCDGTDSLQKKMRAFCETECYPPIKFRTDIKVIEGKSVLAVVVPHSSNRPHFSGPAYVRVGSESKVATEDQYREFVAARSDIGRTLLSYRDTTQHITVVAINKHLGDVAPLSGRHKESDVCRVVSVDPHFVRFQAIDSGRYFNESLQYLRLSRDEEKWRPMVVVEVR